VNKGNQSSTKQIWNYLNVTLVEAHGTENVVSIHFLKKDEIRYEKKFRRKHTALSTRIRAGNVPYLHREILISYTKKIETDY